MTPSCMARPWQDVDVSAFGVGKSAGSCESLCTVAGVTGWRRLRLDKDELLCVRNVDPLCVLCQPLSENGAA
eukprot:6689033-Pyramimonas_sp.AAC.1